MEDLQLSEPLQRYFSDVFLCCDEENSGNVPLPKTIDLIKSGNVLEDVISQIAEICWTPSTANLTKKQFFSALKLVAAHQANIPLHPEILNLNLELPLPRFTWNNLESEQPPAVVPDLIELRADLNDYKEQVDTTSTDSEVDSDTLSIVKNGSPGASSTASDSPTPTNSVQDRSWAVGANWQGLVSEEQRQLLGTEEESSDKHSSDEDTEVSNEIWTINKEQREYYTNQFKSLQPDTNALLAGPIARNFFEKSRLPVHDLRRIWQLADVTRDGALSLQEFNTAMHLVVLKRNHIQLPDVLPASLFPGNDTPLSISPETEPILSPQTKESAKEWTKFVDSPTSSVSSPGPKPVNFDFQKITLDKDSKIFHPVPLRLTPECPNHNNNNNISNNLVDSEQVDCDTHAHSPKRFDIQSQNSAIQRPQPKKITLPGPGAIPPPPPSTDGPISLPAFPPPKKEKPPPPPPRPFKSHGRSSSLDLNKLNKLGAPPSIPPRISPNNMQSKKLVNQRSEGDCVAQPDTSPFANFEDEFEKYENVPEGIFPGNLFEAERKKLFAKYSSDAPRKHGAFEVYRKPASKNQDSSPIGEDRTKWELFQKLQEENTVLLRICQELSQELADVREEKIALKVKLERQLNLA